MDKNKEATEKLRRLLNENIVEKYEFIPEIIVPMEPMQARINVILSLVAYCTKSLPTFWMDSVAVVRNISISFMSITFLIVFGYDSSLISDYRQEMEKRQEK